MSKEQEVAIITSRQEVCDVCKEPGRVVERYKVGPASKSRTVVLCAEHARPINELLDTLLRVGAVSASPRQGPKVRTLDEIEEIKRAREAVRRPRRRGNGNGNGNGK